MCSHECFHACFVDSFEASVEHFLTQKSQVCSVCSSRQRSAAQRREGASFQVDKGLLEKNGKFCRKFEHEQFVDY